MRNAPHHWTAIQLCLAIACAVFAGAAPMTAKAQQAHGLAAQVLPLADGWAPTEDLYWLGDDQIGLVAARRGAEGPDRGFLRITPDGAQEVALPLMDESHCRRPDGSFLFRGQDGVTAWPSGAVATQDELSACLGAFSAANDRFEPRFGRQEALARAGDLWAGVAGRGADGAELLLYTETETLGRWPVALPLWQDTVIVDPLPDAAGFLIYPSFRAARRAELRDSTPGIPVWRLQPGTDPQLVTVPWAAWNDEGLYRFVQTDAGLMAALVTGYRAAGADSGLYHQAAGWAQIRRSDILPETLTLSPDGCRAAWLERDIDQTQGLPRLAIGDVCAF